MKSKITKIQTLLKKGISIALVAMFLATPITYATTSLDDSYLESSWWEQVLYGKIGSTAKEIEEYFNSGETTLYITNETQLRALAEYVNNGNTCEGKEIILINDIEISNEQWVPIGKEDSFGNEDCIFNGTFNGNGYTIKGVTYTEIINSDEYYQIGLFGVTGKSSNIKNLKVEDFSIKLEAGLEKFEQAIFCGNIVGRNQGIITYCLNKSKIEGIDIVGGIAGANHGGTIVNCTNEGNVVSSSINSELEAIGGIAGISTDGIISKCINSGKIEGNTDYCGGIVGVLSLGILSEMGTNISIVEESINNGEVIGTEGVTTGNIAGRAADGIIIYCINYYANKNAVCGEDLSYSISNCINYSSNEGIIKDESDNYQIGMKDDCSKTKFPEGYEYNYTTERVELKEEIGADVNPEKLSCTLGDQKVDLILSRVNGIDKTNELIGKGDTLKSGDKIYVMMMMESTLSSSEDSKEELEENQVPKMVLNNSIEMTPVKDKETGKPDIIYGDEIDLTWLTYEYEVRDIEDEIVIGSLQIEVVTDIYAHVGDTSSKIEKNTTVKIIDSDFKAPFVNSKVYVENPLKTGIYTAGKEVLIDVTTSEPIQVYYDVPELQVSFSESGVGKYNYEETDKVGYAKIKNAKINDDGTTTWTYSYQIQEGDEGSIKVAYTGGKITDLAGNKTELKSMLTPIMPEIKGVEGIPANIIESITVSDNEDKVDVDIVFKGILYTEVGTEIVKEGAPKISFDGNIYNTVDTVTNDEKSELTYSIDKKDLGNMIINVEKIFIKVENDITTSIEEYTLGKGIYYAAVTYNEGENHYVLDPKNLLNSIDTQNIIADTTAPTVTIEVSEIEEEKTDTEGTEAGEETKKEEEKTKISITNKSELTYNFIFNEKVIGFDKSDITVNNGTIDGELSQINDKDGKPTNTYSIKIKPSVQSGNVGQLQVIVEQNAVKDLVAHSNVRSESIITVDKKAPKLETLEVYGIDAEGAIIQNKEYYKANEKVKVVATFDENIASTKTVPTLALQFSESGKAKGTVTEGTKAGNTITYTYTITNEDNGKLSIKEFSGTVVDVAGNGTVVTKRELTGNNVIADTTPLELKKVTVIAPEFKYPSLLDKGEQPKDTKRYGIRETITIITEYSENVYKVDENTDVPALKLKFGINDAKGSVSTESIAGKTITYTYTITAEDNGTLAIDSLAGKLTDVAGNTTDVELGSINVEYKEVTKESKLENVDNIIADTRAPMINAVEVGAINYDDNGNEITGNDQYYRKGAVITVEATVNEYVYKNTEGALELFEVITEGVNLKNNAPTLNVSFGNETGTNKTAKCEGVEYKENKTIFTYEYEIQDNENGALKLSFAKDQVYEIALNANIDETEIFEKNNIIADTKKPHYNDQPGIEYVNGHYQVTFNEKVYYLDDNNEVKEFGQTEKAPLLKFEGQEVTYSPSINENVITYNGAKVNAKPYLGASKLCDKAGNLYAYYDQIPPTLVAIEIDSLEDKIYKAGDEITIIAKFSEKLDEDSTAPTLDLKFGENDAEGTVSTGTIEGNTIKYTYTVATGDNGKLSIKSYEGGNLFDLTEINKWEPGNEPIELYGNSITADTIAPTVTITSDVQRTNKDVVVYKFTWNEPVKEFTIDDIEVTNGSKGKLEEDGTKKVYTLTVDTTNEGRQIVKVNSKVCTDKAGNENEERTTYNSVIIDYTKPVLRANVNGGNYVIDTDTKKSLLKETIVVSEDLSKFEYAWSTENDVNNVSNWNELKDELKIGDINLSDKVNEGTYYLYIKATDLAGNVSEVRTNGFVVKNSAITFEGITSEPTNENVIVTVKYGEGLTENRKAGISGKTQSADSTTVILSENGTVYAEATDKAGNKVYESQEVSNINKGTSTEQQTSEIKFKDLLTMERDGIKYVKVSVDMTKENLTAKMDKEALNGKTPEYKNLTKDNKLKTGSEITLDGKTKYIIAVSGDINCDGKVTFDDIIKANAIRISSKENTLSVAQLLAVDINNTNKVEFRDIISINAIRINSAK